MNNKTIALILAALFALSLLASCSGGGGETSVQSQSESVTAEDDGGVTEYVKSLAEGRDFSGQTFTYIGKDDEKFSNFPVKEEETGDISSDALYFRQRDLEEFFGIEWESVRTKDGDETGERVINEVTAGGNSYDLTHGSTLTVGQFLLNAGVIRSVDDFKTVDLDRDWWLDALQDDYLIGGRLFFLTGPIMVNNYGDASCILFNKNVTAMFGIDDASLYDTVRDGKWTIDEMFRVAEAVPENTSGVSGNGVWRFQQPNGIGVLMGAGQKVSSFDEDGYPVVDNKLPRELSDLADRICPVFSDNTQSIFVYIAKGERDEVKYGTDKLEEFFIDDRVLFRFNVTYDVMSMRTYDVRFGVLPMPKGNDSQKDYRTWASIGYDSAVYVPRTIRSVDLTDVITEAMGALSSKYVKDAYYEKLLRSQSLYDLESLDMLDIIFSTKVYDVVGLIDNGSMNGFGDLLNTINNGLVYDSSTIASNYRGSTKFANFNAKQLKKAIEKSEG